MTLHRDVTRDRLLSPTRELIVIVYLTMYVIASTRDATATRDSANSLT